MFCTQCVGDLKIDFENRKVRMRDYFSRLTLDGPLHRVDIAGRTSGIVLWECPGCEQPGATRETV